MIGAHSPRVASRSPVATLPASGWQRGQNSQGRSRSSLAEISRKVRNFKLKLTTWLWLGRKSLAEYP